MFFRVALVVLLMGSARWLPAQRNTESVVSAALPDAPQSQVAPGTPAAPGKGCRAAPGPACGPKGKAGTGCASKFSYFDPLGKPPQTGPLSAKNKLQLAASSVVDPFNLITIAATSAITIGSNPETDYGPGMKGWAKNAGTLLTEDLTGEFFGTFLFPSLARQDPRYHRMPKASVTRRILNAIVQPVWTKSDKGGSMLNYGDLMGVPATITLANVYVPDRQQGVWPVVESSATAIGSAPIDNFVSEFLPDVAKHVSIHIVFLQRIVNRIALTGGPV
ncbi:MAG TPA: hypothetical protein VMU92_04980 [Acidobacteriaceae bacterium]|nr:hypothetical protein [Acidobacteriaceae bacterium]